MTLLQWQIQSRGVRAFNCHRRTWAPGSAFFEHGHDYYEVFWVEDGVLDHVWDGEVQHLGVGDCIALVPGETHALRADARRSGRVVNVSLGRQAADDLALRWRATGQPWPWAGDRSERRRILGDRARQALAHLVDLVDLHLATSREFILLGLIHGLSRSTRAGLAGLDVGLRSAVLDCLDQDPTVTVGDLARRLRRSREGLTRACRRQTGRPLADLLRDWRLDRAADLLRGSDRGSDAIAAEVGFQATGGFIKAFKRRFGAAPGAWRRQTG